MSIESEALRYLGLKGAPDGRTLDVLGRILREAESVLSFKVAHAKCAARCTGEGVYLNELFIGSRDLAAHFACATGAIALVGTLGLAADAFMRKQTALGMHEAAVAQAVCAALLEEKLDAWMDDLARAHPDQGLSTRFSPGYGDFDLSYQRDLLALANAKRLGIHLNDALMMLPLKTVTALIALTPGARTRTVHKCALCDKRDCPYREET